MPVDILVGAQWGDEGKAKIIDYLCEGADVVARFQGGANAGHTVYQGAEKFVFHLIPSGILHPDKTCLIGAGLVVDPFEMLAEIDDLERRGVAAGGRVKVCGAAHLLLPGHKLLDTGNESKLGDKKIGTTQRGIGPAYAAKAGRVGVRFWDLVNESYEHKVRTQVAEANFLLANYYKITPPEALRRYFTGDQLSADMVIAELAAIRDRIVPMVVDGALFVRDAVAAGKQVLAEGAQGTGLDLNFGTYPFVTSSHPIAGGACVGIGIGPRAIRNVYGIVKAYVTRVGAGPFPTEALDADGEEMRRVGNEFGATTGRPRRCGWFDGVFGRYACWVNGLSHLIVTKLDVLDGYDEVKYCVGYEVDGKVLRDFTGQTEVLERVEPVYRSFPGWKTPTTGIRRWEDLPANARTYLEFMENDLGVPVALVSVGPERDASILRHGPIG